MRQIVYILLVGIRRIVLAVSVMGMLRRRKVFWEICRDLQLVFARVVIRLDDLGEVAVAFRASETMLVAVPFVLALMAVDHVAWDGLL